MSLKLFRRSLRKLIQQKTFNNYHDLIKENRQLQLDGELCLMLRRTPSEIALLEESGDLSYDEKMFLYAFLQWRTEFCLENNVHLF